VIIGVTRQGEGGSPRGRTTWRWRTAIVVGMTTTTYAHRIAKPTSAALPARVLERIRGAAQDAAPTHNYQRALYRLGALLVASGLVHVVVWFVDGGAWAGPVSWRKPILFGLSLGLMCLSLGWIQGGMPRGRFIGWLTTILIGVWSVVEGALITIQRWRGHASHFNDSTPADSKIFAAMAISIGLVTVGIVILEVWAIVRLRGPAPTVIATHVGIVLLLVGCSIGGDLIARGEAYLEETGTIPSEVVIGVAGSGRMAHAFALHAVQALVVLALLLGRSGLAPARRTQLMTLAAVGTVAAFGLVATQAYAGRSMLEVSWPMAVGLAAAATLVAVPFAVALLGPDRSQPRSIS
jgi:hypothetical protein